MYMGIVRLLGANIVEWGQPAVSNVFSYYLLEQRPDNKVFLKRYMGNILRDPATFWQVC